MQINTISTQSGSRAQSLVGTFLSDARHPEVDFLHSFGREILEILGQIVSLSVRTLSNTNFVQSRHIKREKGSLPVYVPRRSKTSLLKLPFNGRRERYHNDCRERLCHGCLVHFVYNAYYVSFFDMRLGKLLVNYKIRASCQTIVS